MKLDFINKKVTIIFLVAIIFVASASFYWYNQKKQSTSTQISELQPRITKEDFVSAPVIVMGIIKGMQAKKIPISANLSPDLPKEFEAFKEAIEKKEKTKIVTDFHLEVEKYIKNELGPNRPELTIRWEGGTIGNESTPWAGPPPFVPDQKVLVFLSPYYQPIELADSDQNKEIFGLALGRVGKYTITPDNKVGEPDHEKITLKVYFGKKDFALDEFVQEIEILEKNRKEKLKGAR